MSIIDSSSNIYKLSLGCETELDDHKKIVCKKKKSVFTSLYV